MSGTDRNPPHRLPRFLAVIMAAFVAASVLAGAASARADASDAAALLVSADLEPVREPEAPFAAFIAADHGDGSARAATIFPPDDRVEITETREEPWRNVALVIITDKDGEPNGACSGTVLGPNVVLTAAHCLYASGKYEGGALVAPAATADSAPFGIKSGKKLLVPPGWISGEGKNDGIGLRPLDPFDWGLIILDGSPFGSQLAPYPYLASAPDAYFTHDDEFASAGYPGDKPAGSMWASLTADHVVTKSYLITRDDSTNGDSGGPIFTSDGIDGAMLVLGVISAGSEDANAAIRMTPAVIAAVKAACAANGCSVSSRELPEFPVSDHAFCQQDERCTEGRESLEVGRPAFVAFTLSGLPDATILAEFFWNDVPFRKVTWPPGPPPAAGEQWIYFLIDPGLGWPREAGKLRARISVGGTFVGEISADVVGTTVDGGGPPRLYPPVPRPFRAFGVGVGRD